MKSERRHELHHNALGAFFIKAGEFVKAKGNYLAWGLLIVALIVFVSVFAWNKHKEGRDAVQVKYNDLLAKGDTISAEARVEQLTTLAQQEDNEFVAAQASLTLANEYYSRAIIASGRTSDKQRDEFRSKARQFYTRVADKFADQPAEVAQAYIGLGRLSADEGNFDKASEYFNSAQRVAPANTPVATAAKAELDNLKTLKTPVQMSATAPALPKEPATTTATTATATTGAATTTAPNAATGTAPAATGTAPATDEAAE